MGLGLQGVGLRVSGFGLRAYSILGLVSLLVWFRGGRSDVQGAGKDL